MLTPGTTHTTIESASVDAKVVEPLVVLVVIGTTRESRFSERVAAWALSRLQAAADQDVRFNALDLREHPLPFFDGPGPAKSPRAYATEAVERLGRLVDRADAFIVLTADYNHGYPAVLKNAMDWLFVEWGRKPISFVGWGNVGGANAIEQLREVAVGFDMAPLRHAVHIMPDVMTRAREVADSSLAFAALEPRLRVLADDLLWWARALRTARRTPEAPRLLGSATS
jgi:NAD(P)H-dependent FMN reductase